MAELSITELSDDIRAAIAGLKERPEIESVGVITRVGDGIAWIYGLSGAGYNEMLEIDGVDGKPVTAFALNLGEDEIGAVLLGERHSGQSRCHRSPERQSLRSSCRIQN